MNNFPTYHQPDSKDCGPTCLKIIAKHFGKTLSLPKLRQLSETHRDGSSLLALSNAAEQLGFRTLGVKLNTKKLAEAPLPCILHWNNNHFVVLYKITAKGGIFKTKTQGDDKTYYISDPAVGLITYNETEFLKFWIGNNATSETEEGIALLLEPTPKFYQ
ncbi:cysteine peptidase family C39 domain-containing protein, partial [Flavobacterium aurantiibacter]